MSCRLSRLDACSTGFNLGLISRLDADCSALPLSLMPRRLRRGFFTYKTIDLPCRPMPGRHEFEAQIAARLAFIDELRHDPAATWFCGVNFPEQLTVAQKTVGANVQVKYLREGLRLLDAGEEPRHSLSIPLGAVRLGDVAVVLSPGENFNETGTAIRARSPFTHTLICGDTNGQLGYIGTDEEMSRGGYEVDSYWKMLYVDGFRLPLAKGAASRIIETSLELLQRLHATMVSQTH